MKGFKKLAHAVWKCKYHLVWCPKYRFRILKGDIGKSVRDILKQLCEWKGIEILAGNVQADHIHLVLTIPPKHAVSDLVGFLKGKSAIKVFDMHDKTVSLILGSGGARGLAHIGVIHWLEENGYEIKSVSGWSCPFSTFDSFPCEI